MTWKDVKWRARIKVLWPLLNVHSWCSGLLLWSINIGLMKGHVFWWVQIDPVPDWWEHQGKKRGRWSDAPIMPSAYRTSLWRKCCDLRLIQLVNWRFSNILCPEMRSAEYLNILLGLTDEVVHCGFPNRLWTELSSPEFQSSHRGVKTGVETQLGAISPF